MAYYGALNRELLATGELVQTEILTGPDLAKVVTSDGITAPVVTDGPFQEFKEWVAGFQVFDVDSEERAIEIAARISAVPGPGGRPIQQPIQVRRIMQERPADRSRDGRVARDRRRRRAQGVIADPSPVEDLLRDLAPQVLGTLTRQSGDFDAAEDAVQEALIAAADHWPREGIPENPRAWLLRTAGRRLVDQRRSEQARANRELQVGLDLAATQGIAADEDDTLAVLFMCCHPSLTPASAIALTLRAVGGLTTPQIARAFLVPEATMGQRISRAKRTIKESGVPFRLPTAEERPGRDPERPPRPLPDVQRGLRHERRRRSRAAAACGRGDPPCPDGPPPAPRRPGGRRPPRADAADRGPPAGPDHRRRRADPARPNRTATPWDRGADRGGHDDPRRRRSRRAASASTSSRRRSPRSTIARRPPTTPTGSRSSPCTSCSSG